MAPAHLSVRYDGPRHAADEGYESQQYAGYDGLDSTSTYSSDCDTGPAHKELPKTKAGITPPVIVSNTDGGTNEDGSKPKICFDRKVCVHDDGLSTELRELSSGQNDQADRALLAPFREGGLPTHIAGPLHSGPQSDVTDLGEERFATERQHHGVPIDNPLNRFGYDDGNGMPLQHCLFDPGFELATYGRQFFPRDDIESMITPEVVYRELQVALKSKTNDEILGYSRKVCTASDAFSFSTSAQEEKPSGFRKIFITLVIIAKAESIVQFIDEGVNDLELPLTLIPRMDGHHGTLKAKKSPERLNCCEDGWSPLNIRNFHDYQWTTLAPFFGEKDKDKDAPHYFLGKQITLPFTEHSAIAKRGGFGQVYKTRIHPQHHNFHEHTNGDDLFAVKSLDSTDRETFEREVQIMKQLSKKNQKHLLPLLASYEQSDRYYLIFPWAESDLCEYWEKGHPDPLFNQTNVEWVAKQCQGIASGLSRIHQWDSTQTRLRRPSNSKDIMGYHGDIKPANILWFKDDNVLKLSDFGLSDFDTRHTRSRRPKTNPCASPTYRAPEWDSPKGSVAGRSYDIWGLGCVFLEFVTWLVGGRVLVNEFAKNRLSEDYGWIDIKTDCFFTTENPGTDEDYHIVKPAVTDWFKKLRSLPHYSKFVKEFLDLIEKDMLVFIEGSETETQQRLDVRQVAAELSRMVEDCASKEGYACCPIKRPIGGFQ